MKLFLKTKDFSVSGEPFELHKDAQREMLVTQPVPENLARYYESEDYISHTDAKITLTDKVYQAVKRINLKRKVQLIDNQSNKYIKLLDIGAGTGDFLAMAKSQGFVVDGVEPSEIARINANKKGIQLHADLDALDGQRFNVITLWHVLEHLPDLDKQIERIVSLLEENGTLIVAVPNYNSFDAKHYKSFWAGYDVPRHLWHFSRKSISTLFQRHDMDVVKTKPMWFDAFYVSMLSEKYKGSPLYLVSAFFVGLWSNIRACFNKEYSSIIYILRSTN